MPENTEAQASQSEQSQASLFDFPARIGALDPKKMMEEFNKVLSQYQVPGLDMSAMLEMQRKNVEALGAANRAAFDGMQTLAAHQGQILRETIEQTSAAITEVGSAASSATDMPAKQAELFTKAFETALENMRQLADVTSKSNTEVFDILKDRTERSLDEIKQIVQKTKG